MTAVAESSLSRFRDALAALHAADLVLARRAEKLALACRVLDLVHPYGVRVSAQIVVDDTQDAVTAAKRRVADCEAALRGAAAALDEVAP